MIAASRNVKNWKLIGVVLVSLVCAAAVALALYSGTAASVEGDTPQQRLAAVNRVSERQPHGAARALAQAATDSSPQVRQAALIGLGQVLKPEHRPVVEQASRDPEPSVRAIAADTLGIYEDSQAADRLIELIENDPDERVRLSAIRSLARCDDPRSIVVLLETADKAKEESIRLQAMKFFLWKFKANLRRPRDPRNEAMWKDIIQRWKWDRRVRDAYAAAGAQLIDRPQDIVGKVYHPERHDYSGPLPRREDSQDRPQE